MELCSEFSDWSLHIYGKGEHRKQIQDYIDRKAIGKCVFLKGYVNDIDKAYAESSVYLSTSAFESFGLTFIEAMKHGLPIVSTDGPLGAQYLLGEGRGTLVPQGNIDNIRAALRKTMQAVSSNSPDLRMQIQNNLQYVRRFSRSKIESEWNNAFKLLSSSQQGLENNTSHLLLNGKSVNTERIKLNRIQSWICTKLGCR